MVLIKDLINQHSGVLAKLQRFSLVETIHCVRSHDDTYWAKLTFHNAKPLFKEGANRRMYAELNAIERGELVACVKQNGRHWWVKAHGRQDKLEHADLVFQLWECVENWIARIAVVAERVWPKLAFQSIQIELDLPNLPNWKEDAIPQGLSSICQLTVHVDIDKASIQISLPEGFLQKFNTPKNVAEREIICAILNGLSVLSGSQLDAENSAKLAESITQNDNARYFHIVKCFTTFVVVINCNL